MNRLVFVYNANAGLLAGALDSLHKMLSPATYPCSLCAITYGSFTMDRRWRDWLRTLPIATEFYHRPDFRAAFPHAADWPLPLVAIADDNVAHNAGLRPLIDAATLDGLTGVDPLIALLAARLRAAGLAV